MKGRKQDLSLIHETRLLIQTYIPALYYQKIPNGLRFVEYTGFCLKTPIKEKLKIYSAKSKEARIVIPARNMPLGPHPTYPDLHPNKILSNNLKGHRSYGQHKILPLNPR